MYMHSPSTPVAFPTVEALIGLFPLSGMFLFDIVGAHGKHIDFFKLKLLKKQPLEEEHSDTPLSPESWK